MNLVPIFLIGLTSGGLSCLAVQGGFLASIIANQKERNLDIPTPDDQESTQTSLLPLTSFLVAKLIAHILLGAGLGLLGSMLTLSDTVKLLFQTLAALFMLATALNLLEVHPIFRYLVFQPPAFIRRRIRRVSKDDSIFAPFVLGLFTIFIPCGVTQAMEVQAIALGTPIQSALLMGAFVLGTIPLFSIIGVAFAKLSDGWTRTFLRFAALALIVMSLVSLNGVLEVTQFPVSGTRIARVWTEFWTPATQKRGTAPTAIVANGVQDVSIDIQNNGYNPRYIRVQAGTPVKLTLKAGKVYSCAVDFRLPAFGIKTFMQPNTSQAFTFTPSAKGKYTYTCGMGMYTGVLEAI